MPVAFFIMPSALRNLFPILQNILKCALPGSSFYSAFYEMHDISIKIKNVIVFQYLNNILLHNTCKCYHWMESEGILLVDFNKKILSAEYWCTMVLKFGNARREIIIKMCTKIMQLNAVNLVGMVCYIWLNEHAELWLYKFCLLLILACVLLFVCTSILLRCLLFAWFIDERRNVY